MTAAASISVLTAIFPSSDLVTDSLRPASTLETSSVSSTCSFFTEDALCALVCVAFLGVCFTAALASNSSEDEASLRLTLDLCRFDRLTGGLSGVSLLSLRLWLPLGPDACIGELAEDLGFSPLVEPDIAP